MNNPFEAISARLDSIETLLLDIKHEPKSKVEKTETVEFLTVQETAKFLSLSVPTIYGLISKKVLPVIKRSKRCYFSKTDLIEYLNQGRKKTNSEISVEADLYLNGRKERGF